MVIVAANRSWKETRDVMMRKYLAAEKMATETDLAAVQRKNFATYNDFLREFTLVALRIPGVTDRIMSKYFLRQFSEFVKDKILSAYQQRSKFVNTRDVDFSTVTDLGEKTVVKDTLALLKEGEEVIDLTSRTGDKEVGSGKDRQDITVADTTAHDDGGPRRKMRKDKRMEFGNENDSEAINRRTGGEEAGPSQGRRAAKRKLYIGLMGGPVLGKGGRKCLCRKPSPLREGEGIEISFDSEGGKEKAEVEEGGNVEMGDKVQVSDEEGVNRGKRRETWHEESEGGQDMRDEHGEGEERRESPLEGRSGHDSCEGYGTGTKIPFTYDPKNLAGGYSPIQTEGEDDEEEDVREVIKISSGDERDKISRPREEGRPPMHQPGDGAFK
ncbi:hypothetical protein CBR_g44336 [Chara braunii]|uniref:Retrotransposon gag domain-containing protein n=1 Tax=Chara braunii TaxID=69332 RepID=A0A388K320_CHABU|nr:hypothetical protein CBR_g44336 [Chara braunii]|eukprot:GBG64451.1 hypothetical protein CBR_g44336 [Chara braunii]